MYTKQCPNDPTSWIEIQEQFDTDGHLHLAINEMWEGKNSFKEQCVYLNRKDVEIMVLHLLSALQRPCFGSKE